VCMHLWVRVWVKDGAVMFTLLICVIASRPRRRMLSPPIFWRSMSSTRRWDECVCGGGGGMPMLVPHHLEQIEMVGKDRFVTYEVRMQVGHAAMETSTPASHASPASSADQHSLLLEKQLLGSPTVLGLCLAAQGT
jgi:hypothetical protein